MVNVWKTCLAPSGAEGHLLSRGLPLAGFLRGVKAFPSSCLLQSLDYDNCENQLFLEEERRINHTVSQLLVQTVAQPLVSTPAYESPASLLALLQFVLLKMSWFNIFCKPLLNRLQTEYNSLFYLPLAFLSNALWVSQRRTVRSQKASHSDIDQSKAFFTTA